MVAVAFDLDALGQLGHVLLVETGGGAVLTFVRTFHTCANTGRKILM